MNFVALKMLTGDRAKYLSLVFTIAFASFLLAHQVSIFCGILLRTANQIVDVVDADVWVMDSRTIYFDEVKAMPENDLYRVRGVDGVAWGVRFFRALGTAVAKDGSFKQSLILGLDDSTFVGAPRKMLLGSFEALKQPNTIVIDRAGFKAFFPNDELRLGDTFELNDKRATIVGISEASAPFTTFPVIHTRFSEAETFVGKQRNTLSYVLVKASDGQDPRALAKKIEAETGLKARTKDDFQWETIMYYVKNTGIPFNFGITIVLAFIVGCVVAGQTFYLFTIENLRQYGALKAIGVTNRRIIGMILLQAFVVGALGLSIGMALAATFFNATMNAIPTRGIVFLPQAAAIASSTVFIIVILASLLSIRKVLVLEPAIVFRG